MRVAPMAGAQAIWFFAIQAVSFVKYTPRKTDESHGEDFDLRFGKSQYKEDKTKHSAKGVKKRSTMRMNSALSGSGI